MIPRNILWIGFYLVLCNFSCISAIHKMDPDKQNEHPIHLCNYCKELKKNCTSSIHTCQCCFQRKKTEDFFSFFLTSAPNNSCCHNLCLQCWGDVAYTPQFISESGLKCPLCNNVVASVRDMKDSIETFLTHLTEAGNPLDKIPDAYPCYRNDYFLQKMLIYSTVMANRNRKCFTFLENCPPYLSLLDRLIQYNHTDILGRLLLFNFWSKTTINDSSVYDIGSPLHFAAKTNLIYVFRSLVNRGADINLENQARMTALSIACEEKHMDILQFLIEAEGIRPILYLNSDDDSYIPPFYHAIKSKFIAGVQFFLQKGIFNIHYPYLSVADMNALEYAAEHGVTAIALLFIKMGANVNRVNNHGNTPLHFAARSGSVEMVNILINNKAKTFSTKNNEGKRPLDMTSNQQIQSILSKSNSWPKYSSQCCLFPCLS